MIKTVETFEVSNPAIKLSEIKAKLKDAIYITILLVRFQQLGFVKIVYNPVLDEEPFV
jgi:hypothetical protein